MAIEPHWAYYHLVLKFVESLGQVRAKDLKQLIGDEVQISQEEFDQDNARGTNIFGSRIHWAVTDMVGVGALDRVSRGVVGITDFGRELLGKYPAGLTRKELETLPQWEAWKQKWVEKPPKSSDLDEEEPSSEQTPDERLDAALEELNDIISGDLVRKVQSLKPVAMERLVLKLLLAMGYGADEDSLQHLGGPGDEGVDGVINLDKLGLQKIYVQAKRYKDNSSIDPTTIQAFIGALDSKRAAGGVFITTSDFTKAAREAAVKSSRHIELINGKRLGELLITYAVGVRLNKPIYRAQLDDDFFDELED